ncbi:MAG: hypothetical protein GPJ51_11915 [Candidatus Heimdallarchaeota archaeon]|nr:hypothetical protein [Candidatus Heimdallarchaeota archaeon]
MKNSELYKVSKRVYKEAILHAQLQAAGSNQQRFLERIQKDRVARSQNIIFKFMAAVYIASLVFLPVISIFQIYLNFGSNPEWITFAGSLSFSIFFIFQLVILIVFALMLSWGIMSGGPYEWVHTLPFNRNHIQKIGLFTFARSINIQLIVMSLVLPIGVTTAVSLAAGLYLGIGKIFLISIVSIIISVLNTIFNLAVLVILGRKLAIVMEEYDFNSKRANFVRISTMVIYLITSMLVVITIQYGIEKLPILFQISPLTAGSTSIMNIVLSFIAIPFSLGYLMTIFLVDISMIPSLVIVGSVTGFLLYILLVYLVTKKALKTLRNISSPDIKRFDPKRKKTVVDDIKIKSTTPTRAYMKRDISIITRETQQIMILIMPIMIPVYAAILGFTGAFTVVLGNTGLTDLYIVLMFFIVMNSFILSVSLTNIETGGETITASLPINPREQVKAKLPYFFSIIIVAILVAQIFLVSSPIFYPSLYLTLAFLPVFPLIGISSLLFKILLFGKLKNKFAVEEIRVKYKIYKYILGFVFVACLMALFLYTAYVGYWAIFTAEAIVSVIVFFSFNYMFPKAKWKVKYIF